MSGGLPLQGQRVVVTGDVPGMTRDAAQDAVRMLGGTAVGTVNARTDLLVVGTAAGQAKLVRAAELGLRLLPAEQFAELAENPDRWDGQELGTAAAAPPGTLDDAEAAPRLARRVLSQSRHLPSTSSFARDRTWVVVVRCRCGERFEGGTRAEAERLHRAHRAELGDLDDEPTSD